MKITSTQLEKIVTEEIEKEMNEALPFLSQGVSDVVVGNFVYDGINAIGYAALLGLAFGAVKIADIMYDIKRKREQQQISDKKAAAAEKVARLIEKHKSDTELMDLVKQRRMKDFITALKNKNKTGDGEKVSHSTAKDVYHGSKKHLGMKK